jgi:glycosyltransferase involved in cell wall biosynthesis
LEGKKLVSIIVPVYNSEAYIGKCVTSILGQSYENIEVLLINDGSTDGSGRLCDEYAEKDKRIKVIHQTNSGPSAARNKGISLATGDYIQFVDGDDAIEPLMTETMVESIGEKHELVICGYKTILENDGEFVIDETFHFHKTGSFRKEEFLGFFGQLYRDYYIHYNWNKIYVADIIRQFNLAFDAEVIRGEDMLFNLQYLNKCSRIKILPYPFYNYMTSNSGSITSTFRPNLFENQQFLLQKTRDFLQANQAYSGENKDLVEDFYTTRIIACFSNLFHPTSTLSPRQTKKHILAIMWDSCVNEKLNYFHQGNLEKKLVGLWIEKRLIDSIYWYFRIKSFIRQKLNFLGPKSKKWI